MIAFARITGPLLLIAFGGHYFVSAMQGRLMTEVAAKLRNEGQLIFVSLDRAQKREALVSTHYFYTYSGIARGISFSSVEEVSAVFFHLHSEGKSVQARVYVDPTGVVHSHLRGNPIPFFDQNDMTAEIALLMSAAGIILSLFGYGASLIRPGYKEGQAQPD